MLPRQVLPGSTYLLSRRCTQRQFLLTPTATTTAIFGYCLAVAAIRCGVRVHALCVMSNHWHAVITDSEGRVPEFCAYLHRLVARAVNASLGRWENLWATEQPSLVRLLGPDDVLAKTTYVVLNPVAAGLVARAQRWPGLLGYLPRHSQTFRRPEVFFREDGPMPKQARLELSVAPALAHLGNAEVERRVSEQVRPEEKRLEEQLAKAGRRVLGEKRVKAQSPSARPHSREPRRSLHPSFAAGETGLWAQMVERLKAFVAAYREAWRRWRADQRFVEFPAGTYALRIHARVRCQAAPG
jgi:REP element-mobilizing transposase RayT